MNAGNVIIVDDDAEVLALLGRRLRNAGYDVFECGNGDEAFDLVQKHRPAVLLVDWKMPGFTGVDLCRRFRASSAGDDVYIILHTVCDKPEQVTAGLDAGADDYLVKACSEAELLARVRIGARLLRSRAATGSSPTSSSNFHAADGLVTPGVSASKTLRRIQWASIALSVLAATFVLVAFRQDRLALLEQVREHARLELGALQAEVEDYFERLRTDLWFISLDDEVVAMTRDSRDYIQMIYDEHYHSNRLSEIYVIERDFDGTHRPFMTFEHGDEQHDVDDGHSLGKEADEYKAQLEMMRRFEENPGLEAQISSTAQLCLDKPGMVYAVPIRSSGKFVGMVAGMIPLENISTLLETPERHEMVILTNEYEDILGCDDLPRNIEDWFASQFRRGGASSFFDRQREGSFVGKYSLLTAGININDNKKWYLAYLYDEESKLDEGGFQGAAAGYVIAGMILTLGATVAILIRNLCERKKAEDMLRDSEEKYRSVVDNVGIGISVISRDMEILALNRQMHAWFPGIDVSRRPACYRSFNDPPANDICSYCPTRKTLDDGRTHEAVTETPCGDEIRQYRVVSTPLRDKEGAIIAAIEMVDDITELKRHELTLRRTGEELELRVDQRTAELAQVNEDLRAEIAERAQREEELKRAKQQAQKAKEEVEQANVQLLQSAKMVSIGQLAAGIAHEINNPMGFISSNLHSLGEYVTDLKRILAAYDELLSECGQGDSDLQGKAAEVSRVRDDCDLDFIVSDLDNLLTESVEGTKRVRKIVADLRDFSHVDSGEVNEEDINELLDKTINVAWNELKYKTEVVREYGQIPVIPCYGGKLGQVFLNLLVNAAHAIEERGTVTVRTGRDDSHVSVEVEDTGCGMPPDVMDRVFDPFFTTKEVGTGTGMGLHLSYNIIDAHGGSIECKSTVGQGTTFRIELPITGPPEELQKAAAKLAADSA